MIWISNAPKRGVAERRIAITVDDLPAFGSLPKATTRLGIGRQILRAFADYGVTGACGFVNGCLLERDPSARGVLLEWVEAGHSLGNHTFSHINISQVGAEAFIADAQHNGEFLKALHLPPSPRWFRYPELDEGDTPEARAAVAQWLQDQSYRPVPATIGLQDYEFHEPYARAFNNGNDAALLWLRDAFLANARRRIDRTLAFSAQAAGRDVAHILLFHPSAFMAWVLPDLLDLCLELGGAFCPLEEAMTDDFLTGGAQALGLSFVDIRMGGRGNTLKSLNDLPLEQLCAL